MTCPACTKPLRSFQQRLVCDACDGIFMPIADLAMGIHDLTSIEPGLTFVDKRPGTRACPMCAEKMTTCQLRVSLDTGLEAPRVTLDRCDEHGVWFDANELAAVLEKVVGKGYGGGVGRKQVADDLPPDQPRGFVSYFKIGGLKGGWG